MTDIVTTSERIDQLQASIVELEQQLAAEKSARLRAEAEVEKFRSEEWVSGAEVGIFQDRVRNEVIRLTGCPENLIDGKGSDAGWEEFTLAEIGQGIAFVLDQLAAEKARADALDAALNHARHELQAWAKRCDYSIDLGVAMATERLQKERDEARAAGAEMRNWIERRCKCIAPRSKVLSSDWGTGWLSPEDKAEVRRYVEDTSGHSDPSCFSGTPNPECRKCQILALLDGKEAK